jgi:1-phosphofructokinase family hexose kinase
MILTFTPNPCVDKTVFIDCLTPGEKIRGTRCTCIPGGKGNNVARAVKRMGRRTVAVVMVGGHPGAHVVDMIREQDSVDVVPIWVKGRTRTITTVLEESIHRQTPLFEPGSEVTGDDYEATVRVFRGHAHLAKVIALSGTVSDRSAEKLYSDIIPIAHEQGVKTILDAHGPEFVQGLEQQPYMVKPNAEEAAAVVGYALDSDEARSRAAAWFHDKGIRIVVFSLGPEGAYVSGEGAHFYVRPPRIEEVNPVGSGDAMVGGFAIGLMEEMPLEETARLGCAMGAANAMSWDIGHFTREQVEQLQERVTIET